jgi:hypothetical protein
MTWQEHWTLLEVLRGAHRWTEYFRPHHHHLTETHMYVLVEHHIGNPSAFWPGDVEAFKAAIPAHFTLHHAFAGRDGSHGVCIWEAASVDALRNWLDPAMGSASRNVYHEVVNKEGIATPTAVSA